MYTFKNSLKNIKRNIKGYIAIITIVYIMAFILFVSSIIIISAHNTTSFFWNSYGSEVSIDINPEALHDNSNTDENKNNSTLYNIDMPEPLTLKDYEQIATSSYVESATYEQSTEIFSNQLQTDKQNSIADIVNIDNLNLRTSITIIGDTNLEQSKYFKDSQNTLISGNFPTDINEIIISEDLLNFNNLSIGDTIDMTAINDENANSTVTIVGVFEVASSVPDSSNTIYSNYDTVNNFTSESNSSNIDATFTLNSYRNVKDFEQQLYDNGLDTKYYANNNQELIHNILLPLNTLIKIFIIIIFFLLLISLTLLIIIYSFILYKRRFEFKTIRLFGASNFHISIAFITEVFIVCIITIILSIGLGIALVQPLSNYAVSYINSVDIDDFISSENDENNFDLDLNNPQIATEQLTLDDQSTELYGINSLKLTINDKIIILLSTLISILSLIPAIISIKLSLNDNSNIIFKEE